MGLDKAEIRTKLAPDLFNLKILASTFVRTAVFLLTILFFLNGCARFAPPKNVRQPLAVVKTLAGAGDVRFGEVFGVAVDKNNSVFFSDGAANKIWQIEQSGSARIITDQLNTPSGLAIDKNNNLIVADAGSHTIKRVNPINGEISLIAGVENKSGYQNGAASQALFYAPIGVAIGKDDQILVADTYNDKIRIIENNTVRTLAGGARGFADQIEGLAAKFDTPCGIAVAADGEVFVADTGNRRIRKISTTGIVSTFAGTGEWGAKNGWNFEATFAEPIGISIDEFGVIYIADAGSNSIRAFGRRRIPHWEIISGNARGTFDGGLSQTKFNRPANVSIDATGKIFVADSANKLVRVIEPENANSGQIISPENAKSLFLSAEQIKNGGEPRWPYAPPTAPREIAGTFGEVRGAIKQLQDPARFHNGLDIAGALGETARFIRAEKVLRPLAAEDFAAKNNRERLRMPTIGYIHIKLGRNLNDQLFGDPRFLFNDREGFPVADKNFHESLGGVRVPRGANFAAGDAIGTLNPMNHVHLIAGETGAEVNAFAALELPGVKDTVAPKIEKIAFFNENWQELKSTEPLHGKVRIVVRSFDQMNGNNARRRLGVYQLGYQILTKNDAPVSDFIEPLTTISFEKLPENESGANLVYAIGSQSGYTPETVFNYIVTNVVRGNAQEAREDFLDTTKLQNGDYQIRVLVRDFFKNQTTEDVLVQILN